MIKTLFHNLYPMKRKTLATFAAAATALITAGQINSPAPEGFFARGMSMFGNNNYIGTLQQLQRAGSERPLTPAEEESMHFYMAVAALNTGQADALSRFQEFLNLWPTSPRRADALMYIGDCLIKDSYAEALKAYSIVDADALSSDARRADLTYRRAYCLLRLADYDKALPLFASLLGNNEYDNAAKFYQAYIAYAKGDYRNATQLFNTVNTSTRPGCMANFYLSQIYFMDGDYQRALDTARKLISNKDVEKNFIAESNRICGESLYQLGNTEQAIPYLKAYVSAVETPLLSAMYILGVSYYDNADYDDAVKALHPVTDDAGAMGQNAYVYIGQALLKTGDIDGAIMAFDRAAKMTYDTQAAETAYYNYAVAKYSGGNVPFGSSVAVFEDYLNRFPNGSHAEDVRRYIINGYLTDNNYEAALAAINRTKNPSAAVLAAKQRVLYTIGVRDMASGQLDQAVQHLREAKNLSRYSTDYARETSLALGEALYRTGDYTGAEKELLSFLDNSKGASKQNNAFAHFDLGYVYLQQKKYSQAVTQFNNAINYKSAISTEMLADAYNRLGDSYYYLKDWGKAANAYDDAYKTHPSAGDYALFQKAMMQGYAGNFAAKLSGMRNLIKDFPMSAMLPDAMLEMTEAQLRTGDNNGAIATWKELIAKYPETTQGRQAYLQMALTLGSMGQASQATAAYKEIITKYPTSDEAAQAAEILKREAADAGTLDQYIAFINTIDNAPKIDADEADRLAYNAARERAEDKNDFTRLKEYVNRYNNGKYTAAAYALLLENAANKNNSEAIEYSKTVIKRWPDSKSAETAYAVLARNYEGEKKYEDALRSWQALASRASSVKTANDARMGVIRMARELGRADVLMEASEAVLASTATGAGQKNEAIFSLGMAQKLKGQTQNAITTWERIANQTSDVYGAQAAVLRAEALLESGDANAANKAATEFTQSDTPHSYWLARGFIVLADALRAQGKKFEADEYLRAVRDNYPGKETDIFNMIDQRLK